MKLVNPFQYHKLVREDGGPTGRKYITPIGEKLSSVTTILDATKSEDSKSTLENWRKRIGHAQASQITTEAADLGSLVHAHMEAYIKGEDRPDGNNLFRVMSRNMSNVLINQGMINVDEVWGVEANLYHSSLWAGTTDLVGVYNGKPSIMDFKNTIKPKKKEWVQDYRAQLAAYSMAHNWLYGTDINQIVILMVSRDCIFQEFIWNMDDYKESEHIWSIRVAKFYGIDLQN